MQIGTYPKNNVSPKTDVTEISRRDRFVQNYREWRGSEMVSGLGKNPITMLPIVDKNVGYIDVNNSSSVSFLTSFIGKSGKSLILARPK